MINVSALLEHYEELQVLLSHQKDVPAFDPLSIQYLVRRQFQEYWQSQTQPESNSRTKIAQYWIDQIDTWISEQLIAKGITTSRDVPMNTESPGRAFHRISKLNFERVRLEMICETPDVVAQERQEYHQRLAICLLQIDDIAQALQLLINDIHQGRKRHRSYQQIHMYNDPEMNSYLHQAERRMAG